MADLIEEAAAAPSAGRKAYLPALEFVAHALDWAALRVDSNEE